MANRSGATAFYTGLFLPLPPATTANVCLQLEEGGHWTRGGGWVAGRDPGCWTREQTPQPNPNPAQPNPIQSNPLWSIDHIFFKQKIDQKLVENLHPQDFLGLTFDKEPGKQA